MRKHKPDPYTCSVCQKGIKDEFGGYMCPVCGRIICNDCALEHPLQLDVIVRPKGPEYLKKTDMCKFCYDKWREAHGPETQQIDLFGLATRALVTHDENTEFKKTQNKLGVHEPVQKTLS